jgi:hypothetical protein
MPPKPNGTSSWIKNSDLIREIEHGYPFPKARRQFATRLQQGFMTGEMGLGVSLHGSNPKALMSALGQKQTFSDV